MAGHQWEAAGLAAVRAIKIDAMVAELGAVEALRRLEEAEARCLDAACAYAAKGWNGAARGYTAAAQQARGDIRLLVERHA